MHCFMRTAIPLRLMLVMIFTMLVRFFPVKEADRDAVLNHFTEMYARQNMTFSKRNISPSSSGMFGSRWRPWKNAVMWKPHLFT